MSSAMEKVLPRINHGLMMIRLMVVITMMNPNQPRLHRTCHSIRIREVRSRPMHPKVAQAMEVPAVVEEVEAMVVPTIL